MTAPLEGSDNKSISLVDATAIRRAASTSAPSSTHADEQERPRA